MDTNEKILIFNSCKNKTEAYKAFNICPNSKGVLELKKIAEECKFDLNKYKKSKKIEKCLNCGKEFIKEYSSHNFCSRNCSAVFNNKKRTSKLNDKEKEEKRIEQNRKLRESRRLKKKNCHICGKCDCNNKEVCKHSIKWYNNLIPFGFDISKIGTLEVYNEFYKVKDLLYKEYYDNLLSPSDIAKKYNYNKHFENILHILKCFGFETRNLSESSINACLNGKLNTKIKRISDYQFKHGWHVTWDNKKIYYRSSYELDYAKKLDDSRILYEVEYFRIKYWDTNENKYRVAIPDFFIVSENKIVEVKSRITFIKQNMVDKFIEYIKLGMTPILLLENKEYSFEELKNITEFDFVLGK